MDFEDVYGMACSLNGQSKAPHLDMFRGLFAFIDENFPDAPPGRILAQCSMGKSRSAAVGLLAGAYIAQRSTPVEDQPMAARLLVSRLLKEHRSMEPNRTALGMGCCLMGDMGADLMKQVMEQIG